MTTTNLEQVTEQQRTFWQRPEGKTGVAMAVVGVGVAGVGLYHALPYVIRLLENALYAGVLAGCLVVLTMPVWSTKARALASYFFRSIARTITGFVVQLDPIAIIRSYVEDLKKNKAQMEQQVASLAGVMERLSTTISTQTEEARHSMRIAAVAREQRNAKALRLQARKAGRLEESNLTLQALHDKLERLYRYVLKLADVADTMIQDMECEVRVETDKRRAIRSAHGAFSSAMKILHGSPETKELYDMAMEALADDYAMRVGEIEHFMEISEGFIASIDLDNLAFEQEALEKLDALVDAHPESGPIVAPRTVFTTTATTNDDGSQRAREQDVAALFARRQV